MDAQFRFVRLYRNKPDSLWENVLWTYKTKIELFGHNWMKKMANAYSPQNTIPTVKFGGDIITVWDCFSTNGIGNIQIIENRMNIEKYQDI